MFQWLMKWYEEFFPPSTLTASSFVRRVVREMEGRGGETLGGVFLVPNRILMRAVITSEEDRQTLRTFFTEKEVIAALTAELMRKGYQTRGALEFVIEEVELRTLSTPTSSEIFLSWPRNAAGDEDDPTQQQVPRAISDLARETTLVLLVTHPEFPRREVYLHSAPTRIGRKDDNQLCFSEMDISRYHAEAQLIHGMAHITDRESTYGTFVNEQRIPANEPHLLAAGDKIRIGKKVTLALEDRDPERTRM